MNSAAAKNPKEFNPLDYGSHPYEPEFIELYDKALAAAQMPPNSWRRPRFYHLVRMLQLTRGINGATVEAGCFRGMASYLMCHFLKKEKESYDGKGHFMLDSFEGLSEPVDTDGKSSKRRFSQGAFTETSVQHVMETLVEFPRIKIIKGWIPDTFAYLPDQKYRFIHVDVDLYQPTLDSLNYFYPRLNNGGIIVCDDYGPWPNKNWPGCAKAVHEFCEQEDIPFAPLDTGNVVIIKR